MLDLWVLQSRLPGASDYYVLRGGFAASRKIFGTSFAAPGATVIHNEIGDFCFI